MISNLYKTTRAWTFSGLVALTSCAAEGDVHNYYIQGNDGSSNSTGSGNSGIPLENCEDLVDKIYACSPEYFEKYERDWGISIDDQLAHFIKECEKVDFFTNAPEYIQCIGEHSCADLNPAEHNGKPWLMVCGEYAPDY